MKILSVVGARPQFIKAAPVSLALRRRHEELLVHSGQHYDVGMSDVFFEELGIPRPDFNLGIGGGTHGAMTGEMLVGLERLFVSEKPDAVLVYGDTDTTLAGGLAAVKLGIPVIHVEAGLRSFNRSMPEEVNRVLVDHISSVMLCPTATAVANLATEGIVRGVELVGDVMLDTARRFGETVDSCSVLDRFQVSAGAYYFATLHRAAASDSAEALSSVIRAFARLPHSIIWAMHPRTAKNLERMGLDMLLAPHPHIRVVPPVSYTESISLLKHATALVTDSGGMQKEAYFFEVPCVTMREETEWVETVESGWNRLVGTDEHAIVKAVTGVTRPAERPEFYGDGHAAEKIVEAIERALG